MNIVLFLAFDPTALISFFSLCSAFGTTGILSRKMLRKIPTMFHAKSRRKPSTTGRNCRIAVAVCEEVSPARSALSFALCVACFSCFVFLPTKIQSQTGACQSVIHAIFIRISRSFFCVFCVSAQRFFCVNAQKIA